ncbi:unnamed protein product, partial [Linum tenue]
CYAETILQLLKHGAAHFELVPSPVPSISATPPQMRSVPFFANNSHRFFARIGPALDRAPPETKKKLEQYSVQKVTGDGRCLFRALVKGMALNKGIPLKPREERDDADDLRMAVKEIICQSGNERQQYEEALIAITVDEPLKRSVFFLIKFLFAVFLLGLAVYYPMVPSNDSMINTFFLLTFPVIVKE